MSTRIHMVVSDELLAAVDGVRGDVPRSAWLRRVIEREVARAGSNVRAVEQALGSPGSPDAVAGVRGRVPAPVPAEQPGGYRVVDEGVSVVPVIPPGCEPVIPVSSPRVRSSAAARPFRPAPKKGEK